MQTQHIDALAQKLWNYHLMHNTLIKSDALFVLGSHDIKVAEYAAQLFLDGWAPRIIFSGGLGRITSKVWTEPEADIFARVATNMGVPESCMIIENRSTNTGENIRFTKALLHEQGLVVKTIIAVQKPYMERRVFASLQQQWPDVTCRVTSPQLSYFDYTSNWAAREQMIHIIVGDLERIKTYPAKGYQTFQEIPHDVMDAYEQLKALGYTKHLTQ